MPLKSNVKLDPVPLVKVPVSASLSDVVRLLPWRSIATTPAFQTKEDMFKTEEFPPPDGETTPLFKVRLPTVPLPSKDAELPLTSTAPLGILEPFDRISPPAEMVATAEKVLEAEDPLAMTKSPSPDFKKLEVPNNRDVPFMVRVLPEVTSITEAFEDIVIFPRLVFPLNVPPERVIVELARLEFAINRP